MNFWQIIILGVIEGFTEFLPISSTAHLILTTKVLNIGFSEFVKSFEIAIQLGAILGVVFLYWKKIIFTKKIIKKIVIAFLPTAFFGAFLYKLFKNYLMENLLIIVWMLVLGGVFLIIFESWYKEKKESIKTIEEISNKNCFLVGIFQSLAIIPGVSRAAATILGGLFLGISRKTIVEFSFLLAIPTMLGATTYDLLRVGFTFSSQQFVQLLAGFLISCLVAIITVKGFLRYIQKHDFRLFGFYRIGLGLIFYLLLVFNKIMFNN
ncbi:MAG: undecaprenyl-diphosphate phosphatase [Microgenomates group bacterium]